MFKYACDRHKTYEGRENRDDTMGYFDRAGIGRQYAKQDNRYRENRDSEAEEYISNYSNACL